jgi:RNA polymerase sigma-70 factor (ECF subfamily)
VIRSATKIVLGSLDMDAESADWLNELHAQTPMCEAAQSRLHSLLLRVAHAEARRRSGTLPAQTIAESDDLCMQAANDALAAIVRKLDEFKGLSLFTTWASKFVILEISCRLRCNAWQSRRIAWDDADWKKLRDLDQTADRGLEEQEQLQLLRKAVAGNLTERQRRIINAAIVEEVPIDVLADRLGTSRGSIYKSLHDARAKLRQALEGHQPGAVI